MASEDNDTSVDSEFSVASMAYVQLVISASEFSMWIQHVNSAHEFS